MTLAAASISKARAPSQARAGWSALAPERLRALPFWLPAAAEAVLVAALLIPGPVGRFAPLAACALFAAFAVALAGAVRRREPGECGCFGSFSAEPISRLSVVRTASLAAVAALAAVSGWTDPGLVRAMADASRRDVVTGVAGVGLGTLSLVLSVLLGRALSGPGAGATPAAAAAGVAVAGDPIPAVELVTGDGRVLDLRDAPGRAGLVLVVARLDCAPCAEVLPELAEWQAELGHGARIVVVTSTSYADFVAAHPALAEVTYLGAGAPREAFGMLGVPAAILLGVDGRVATAVAHGPDEIRALLAGTVAAVQAHSSPSR